MFDNQKVSRKCCLNFKQRPLLHVLKPSKFVLVLSYLHSLYSIKMIMSMESPHKTRKPNVCVCVCVNSCVVATFRDDKCTHIHTSFSKKEGSQTLSGLSSH